MKWPLVLFWILFCKTTTAYQAKVTFSENNCNSKRTDIDNIIDKIKSDKWDAHEKSCYNDTLDFLYNVKNGTVWAAWIWDSNPRPTATFYGSKHQLGGYDQCLKAPWIYKHPGLRTQYCLADVLLSKDIIKREREVDPYETVEEYFQTTSEAYRNMNKLIHGVCLPAICEQSSVTKILKIFLEESYLNNLDINVNINYCKLSGEEYFYPMEFYIFLILFILLILMTVTFTWFVKHKNDNSFVSSVQKAFSIKHNLSDLVARGKSIPSISVLKTIMAVGCTCFHHYYFSTTTAPLNSLDYDKFIVHNAGSIIYHADVGVDGFYALAGLLLVKSFMSQPKNPLRMMLTRYLRLVVPLAVMVFYITSVSYHTGSGPLWHKLMKKNQDNCKKNWLWSLLMVDNYVNETEACEMTWWYIPTDFHMATLGTLVVYLCPKKKVGKVFLAVISAILVAIPAVVTYWNNYSPVPMYDIESSFNPRENEQFIEMYIKTHNRIGPFIVGMVAGCILSTYKAKNYRHIISKKWTDIGIVSCVVASLAIIGSGDFMMKKAYSPIKAGIYVATNRPLYAVFTCAFVLLAEYGDSTLINYLQKSPIFGVMNRLSYSFYLTHTSFIYRRLFSSRGPYSYDPLSMFMDSFGIFVSTLCGSFLLWMLVEAPLATITNHLLYPKKKHTFKHYHE